MSRRPRPLRFRAVRAGLINPVTQPTPLVKNPETGDWGPAIAFVRS